MNEALKSMPGFRTRGVLVAALLVAIAIIGSVIAMPRHDRATTAVVASADESAAAHPATRADAAPLSSRRRGSVDATAAQSTLRPQDGTAYPPEIAAVVARVKGGIDAKFAGRPGERYPVTNVAASFSRLAALADDGDLQAARTLFEDLDHCRGGPKTPAMLQKAVDRFRSSQSASDTPIQIEAREGSIAVNEQHYRYCAGVTDEHVAQRRRFGEQLAQAGDARAKLDYLNFAFPSDAGEDLGKVLPAFEQRGLAYLHDELERGNPAALWKLGSAYQNRRLNLINDTKAYTYFYAYAQMPGLRADNVVYRGLARLGETMSAAQRTAAEQEALALYARCCGR